MWWRKTVRRRLVLAGVLLVLVLLFYGLERHMMPIALSIAKSEAQNLAGKAIDAAVLEVSGDMEFNAGELLHWQDGQSVFSANTSVINYYSAKVNQVLTEKMHELSRQDIDVPLGNVLGVSLFANRGPHLEFLLENAGAVRVEYETEIISVGINQINLQIWVDAAIEIYVSNPLIQDKVRVSRKLILVNVFVSGEVPEKYFELAY